METFVWWPLSHYAPTIASIFYLMIMTIEEKKKRKQEYDKEYRKRKKEKIAEYKHNYYLEHKEEKQEYDKRYRTNTTEHRKKIKAAWNKKHKEKTSKYNKEYYATLTGLAKRRRNHYLAEDKYYGHDSALTVSAEWIEENILRGHSCIYCGDSEPSHLGCDRIDNEKGHSEDNIVCACPICNWERSLLKMTVEGFIEYRKTHPRLKKTMSDGVDRLTGERKPLKKKDVSLTLYGIPGLIK